MSQTICLTGNSSELRASYFPSIPLEGEWECALLNFQTYYNIFNLRERGWIVTANKNGIVPKGMYEVADIEAIGKNTVSKNGFFELKINSVTQTTELFCSEPITFSENVAKLLGFKSNHQYTGNKMHSSPNHTNILPLSMILVHASLADGAYVNGERTHSIHSFFPQVPPGYRIIEAPNTLIYYPVIFSSLNNVMVEVLDENGKLIDFNGETVSISIHLKRKTE